jgi:hypothetical protein
MSWTRRIFISHCWDYSEYDTLKEWLDNAKYYQFADCSISVDKKLVGLNDSELTEAIKEHIRQCSVFIVPTAMYVNYSDWIQFEINTAVEMGKPILAVTPWGQKKESKIVKENATKVVGWNQNSVIAGIKELTKC